MNGRIAIAGSFKKPFTTDDVTYEIIREVTDVNNTVISTDTILNRKFAWNEIVNKDTLFEVNVSTDQNIRFKVNSNSNIDWSAIDWRPYI
jgi:hypothetical protein